MHLALVILSLNAGGAERVLSELANYWSSQGHQVTIVTLAPPETPSFYPLTPAINLVQLGQLDRRELSGFSRLSKIIKRIFCLRQTVRVLNPDVVVSFIDLMNIATLVATIGLKIPILISERIDPHFHKIPLLYRWLRFKVYPLASRLIVQTNSASKYFPKKFKIKIIPNPVKTPKLQKEKYSERITNIITIGRLDPQKDQKTLIYAFYNLLQHHPHLTLTIYGEGKERDNLLKLIYSLNLKEHVFLPGVVKDISEALLDADLFIFPSLYEGFPNALCEAMAVGLPVIASNCSGNIDIIQDRINGRLFPVGNVQMLTEVALEVLSDSDLGICLAKNAKKVCYDFNPSHIFSMWDKCLTDANLKRKDR